ncbi:thiol-disulfide isomerase/thioredoxin [Pseudomonas frederiksbergensis]|uniref:TlpA family protein disulfide reductase n=1 Tax=Pseudomonas TaxID=286 RepID=UPI003D238151
MNQKFKLLIAFIAGGIALNASSVFSNASNPNDVLADAIANAMAKVDQYSKDRENEAVDKLPNILDCQNMEWMKNCTEMNRAAKKNPSAPMRFVNKTGLEFNFSPGTPSAMIRLQLEQSPEAAKDYLMYMDKTWGEYTKSAELYKMATWQAGELQNMKGLDAAKEKATAVKYINTDQISMSVFVESTCPVCERQLGILSSLQAKYPKLKIKVFQLDTDKDAFAKHVTNRGLTGRIVSGAERAKLETLGITAWPISWVDNNTKSARTTLVGNKTLSQLEDRLQAMTYIQSASKESVK